MPERLAHITALRTEGMEGSALIGGVGLRTLKRITFDSTSGPRPAVWMLEDANPRGLFHVTPK
jgi:hypothetical protein